MRQLRLVRITEDAGHLVVATTDDSEQFALSVDAALHAAVQAALPAVQAPPVPAIPVSATPAPAPPTTPPPVATATEIGPREIQVRVRAGESPQELADSLGVPLERVMRFAGPVVDERLRITDEARRARAQRTVPDGAASSVVAFGEAVDERFTAHGIAATDVTWDSRRRDDGEWIVQAEWIGGEGTHRAEWAFHRSSRSISAIDDTASDLLSDRPIRPLAPPVAELERLSLAAAPRLAPGVVAFPPMPDAHTGPMPRYEDVFDQDAASEGPRDVPPFFPVAPELDFDEPPLPLAITDPTTRPGSALPSLTQIHRPKRDESDADRAARSRIPSWDDILLGVRRKQD
ncbi:MAG: septation protein SepH [Actinomycetota bacterium]|nr:septation protein SepH [Actinomycetota bacterium]